MILKNVKYREKERLLSKAILKAKPLGNITEFSGSSPTPFIGHYGYPHVNVGILSPPQQENAWEYDAPTYWSKTNKQISDIIGYRTQLVNSRSTSNIKNQDKITHIAREVAMAARSADIDVTLHKKPTLNMMTSHHHAPLGPPASLKHITIVGNTRIPTKIQKVHADIDLKATDALNTLYSKGFDEVKLSRMLSCATFGIGNNRKLVPTRWSITATDDTIGKKQLETVRENPLINEHEAYFAEYLGNYYLIMLSPEPWHYELFELYAKPGPVLEYSTDHENYHGRARYAQQCAGGYYTVRLALAEKLTSRKRQAGAFVIRVISDDYLIPLGVWVTREASRKALHNKPIRFSSKELMLTYAKHSCKKRFGIDITAIIKKRKIKTHQRTLASY